PRPGRPVQGFSAGRRRRTAAAHAGRRQHQDHGDGFRHRNEQPPAARGDARRGAGLTMLSDEKSVRDYLAEKGVVDSGARLEVTPLGGGVSNEVWKIAGDGFAWVLKQSLPKL